MRNDYTTHADRLAEPETLTRELNELDALVHRIKDHLLSRRGHARAAGSYLALKSLRGLLKDRAGESALTYQRRIRRESDARLYGAS